MVILACSCYVVLSRPAGENGIKHTYEDYKEDKVLPLSSSLYHIQLTSCFYSSVTTEESLCKSGIVSFPDCKRSKTGGLE